MLTFGNSVKALDPITRLSKPLTQGPISFIARNMPSPLDGGAPRRDVINGEHPAGRAHTEHCNDGRRQGVPFAKGQTRSLDSPTAAGDAAERYLAIEKILRCFDRACFLDKL